MLIVINAQKLAEMRMDKEKFSLRNKLLVI